MTRSKNFVEAEDEESVVYKEQMGEKIGAEVKENDVQGKKNQEKGRKAKARSCLFTGVSQLVFIRIMTLKSPKAIWNYLKEEYAGDDRIRSMQVLNLRREFELQRMEESETIKEYSNKLLGIANKIKLLGSENAILHGVFGFMGCCGRGL